MLEASYVQITELLHFTQGFSRGASEYLVLHALATVCGKSLIKLKLRKPRAFYKSVPQRLLLHPFLHGRLVAILEIAKRLF